MKHDRPGRRRGRATIELPEQANAFIAMLAPIRRPNTCLTYRDALKRLYAWLHRNDLAVPQLTRRHLLQWECELHRQGLATATRLLTLQVARLFFDHLHENGHLRLDGRQLIPSSDLPKLPQTLPRALSVEADRSLCALLASSDRPTWTALLLLRRTGMRVGELQDLPFDCVREHSPTRRYLKVPVGKLHSERLVPIDDEAATLVSRLQSCGRQPRHWLLSARSGMRISYTTLRRAWRDAIGTLSIVDAEPLTIHRLRHTYATTMLNAGMSIVALKDILGHHDINMTLRYAALSPDRLAEQYESAVVAQRERYQLPGADEPVQRELFASNALDAVVRVVQRNARDKSRQVQERARNVVKRLARIAAQLQELEL